MKVIVYLDKPSDMKFAEKVLQDAMDDTDAGTCGYMFVNGWTAFYQRRASGTVVIHVQPKKDSPPSEAKQPNEQKEAA